MRLIVIFLFGIFPLFLQAQPVYDTVKVPGMPAPLVMAPIPAGSFLMGSGLGEVGRHAHEGPQRRIEISAFYMSAFETSWEQYQAFFNDAAFSVNQEVDAITRPSPPYLDFTLGMGKEGFPASSMQQYGALMFCQWLYQKTGVFYRLPTEAEWEYACRAGGTTPFPFGADTTALSQYAWYAGNSQQKYQPVGKLQPNAWGVYDMLGNVAEWTLDQYDSTYFNKIKDGAKDPSVLPAKKHPRTVKGGHYKDEPAQLRPAARIPTDPVWNRRDPQIPKSKWWNTDAPFIGFRVMRPAVQPTADEVAEFFKQHLFK